MIGPQKIIEINQYIKINIIIWIGYNAAAVATYGGRGRGGRGRPFMSPFGPGTHGILLFHQGQWFLAYSRKYFI